LQKNRKQKQTRQKDQKKERQQKRRNMSFSSLLRETKKESPETQKMQTRKKKIA
jgi:hypothetical protein